MFGKLQAFLITTCKTFYSKIHSYGKVILGQNDM